MNDTEFRNMRLLTYIMRGLSSREAAEQADRDVLARQIIRAAKKTTTDVAKP